MLLGAYVSGDGFSVLTPQYLASLQQTFGSNPEIGCSCILFIAKTKETLMNLLKKPEGITICRMFLASHKDKDTKPTFLAALESVLAPGKEQYSEMGRRLFSNLQSDKNFPQPGQESKSLDWIVECMKTPFDNEETLGLKVCLALCSWDWGVRLLFAHQAFTKYLLDRVSTDSNTVCLLKFDIVSAAIQFPQKQKLIADDVMLLLTEFHKQGAYGGHSGNAEF